MFSNLSNVLPSPVDTVLMAIPSLLGMYFHVNPSQTYNQPEVEG